MKAAGDRLPGIGVAGPAGGELENQLIEGRRHGPWCVLWDARGRREDIQRPVHAFLKRGPGVPAPHPGQPGLHIGQGKGAIGAPLRVGFPKRLAPAGHPAGMGAIQGGQLVGRAAAGQALVPGMGMGIASRARQRLLERHERRTARGGQLMGQAAGKRFGLRQCGARGQK